MKIDTSKSVIFGNKTEISGNGCKIEHLKKSLEYLNVECYFSNFQDFSNYTEGVLKLVKVSDDIGYPYVSMCDRCYKYFIPKDKVVFEGEEPKQYRYRPFKYIYELPFGVGDSIAIRVKKAPFAIYAVVNEIICNDDKIVFISFGTTLSMFSPNHYFNGYEFSINDEWIPFGVECEEDE